MFGDIRSTGEADGNIYHVRFSDGESLLPDPATSMVASVTATVSNAVGVSFATESNNHYALQVATDLVSSNAWNTVSATVLGDGETMTLNHQPGSPSDASYRVLQIVPDAVGP
jgi:hypothetical protein